MERDFAKQLIWVLKISMSFEIKKEKKLENNCSLREIIDQPLKNEMHSL